MTRGDRYVPRMALLLAALAAPTACGAPPERAELPPATVAFGLFGDAPYNRFDERAYRRLIDDVGVSDVAFLVHIGDLHGGRCSDASLDEARRSIATFAVPVVYTPGDNEWADCHGTGAGGHRPLERLQRLRSTFFANPRSSLGARPMPVESQADVAAWSEFVENVRWRVGAFVFTTIHLVGSGNATAAFPSRTRADDEAAERRMGAAVHWLDAAFAAARRDSLAGVVVVIHADPFFELRGPGGAFEPFIRRLEGHVVDFEGAVLFLHGDSHTQRVDHPLRRPGSRDTLHRFTRIETYGSPDVGWVRVVVDTANGRLVRAEPRLMPKTMGM